MFEARDRMTAHGAIDQDGLLDATARSEPNRHGDQANELWIQQPTIRSSTELRNSA